VLLSQGIIPGMLILVSEVQRITFKLIISSEAAKDLIRRMMEIRPDRRIPADEASQHPWITGKLFTMPSTPLVNKEKVDVDSTIGPSVSQFSWGKPEWSLKSAPADSNKYLTLSDAILSGLSNLGIDSSALKSVEQIKKDIATSDELADDRIDNFDSPVGKMDIKSCKDDECEGIQTNKN
jgi:serine/threonine protein kinase